MSERFLVVSYFVFVVCQERSVAGASPDEDGRSQGEASEEDEEESEAQESSLSEEESEEGVDPNLKGNDASGACPDGRSSYTDVDTLSVRVAVASFVVLVIRCILAAQWL